MGMIIGDIKGPKRGFLGVFRGLRGIPLKGLKKA